jgi:protein TonB
VTPVEQGDVCPAAGERGRRDRASGPCADNYRIEVVHRRSAQRDQNAPPGVLSTGRRNVVLRLKASVVLAPLLQQLRIRSGSATMAVVGMPGVNFEGASPNAHLLVGEMPAPHQLETKWWEGTGASFAIHALVLGALIYGAMHVQQVTKTAQEFHEKFNVIFLDRPGPGGGGGGRPKVDVAPPRKPEIVATKPVSVKPLPKPADVPPPVMSIPIQTPQAVQTLPGSLAQIDVAGTGAAGGGKGTGIGTGSGSGVGEGSGGNFGGGVYQAGNGVTSPTLIHEVKPNYTGDAMRAKLQGIVEMEAVVLPDGSVDPKSLHITRSLDSTFGLDEEAKKAVRQWRFRPGMFRGQPVPVQVVVELTFTLR